MSNRLHSVFFIIFPEVTCFLGGNYLNLQPIFQNRTIMLPYRTYSGATKMKVITIFDDVCINMRHTVSAACQRLLPPLEKKAKECCLSYIY